MCYGYLELSDIPTKNVRGGLNLQIALTVQWNARYHVCVTEPKILNQLSLYCLIRNDVIRQLGKYNIQLSHLIILEKSRKLPNHGKKVTVAYHVIIIMFLRKLNRTEKVISGYWWNFWSRLKTFSFKSRTFAGFLCAISDKSSKLYILMV